MKSAIDVTVRPDNASCLVGFTMHTADGRAWFEQHVASEGWQWLGNTLWVERNFAEAIESGMIGDGLNVAS